jgi:hypothetical protein
LAGRTEGTEEVKEVEDKRQTDGGCGQGSLEERESGNLPEDDNLIHLPLLKR